MTSGDGPRLLAREREELDTVATPLREGRRVVAFLVASGAALREVVLAYLREKSGVDLPEPEVLTDADRTLDALSEAASRPPGEVRSFSVAPEAGDVLRTFNWHREKLRRGASVLVWIEGVDGLRALRAMAPDAYSFRDVMVVVRGEEPVLVIPPEEEPIDVERARTDLMFARSPLERAEAAAFLADALGRHGRGDEARRIALEALTAVSSESHQSEEVRVTRALLYQMLAKTRDGTLAQPWRWAQAGLAYVNHLDSTESRGRRLALFSEMPSPFGVDDSAALRALADLRSVGARPALRNLVLGHAALSCAVRRDLRRASELLHDALKIPWLSPHNEAATHIFLGYVDISAGRISAAEERYRSSAAFMAKTGAATSNLAGLLAECFHTKGEYEAAKRVFLDIVANAAVHADDRFRAAVALAHIYTGEGDVARGLADLRGLLRSAASSSRDGHLYVACFFYVECLRNAHEAGRVSPTDLADADADIDIAEDVALSIADDNPPWYTILYPGLRAELLALRPDRLDEAIDLATLALNRARSRWTDAAPMLARALINHLIRAGRLDEARVALATAEPEAIANRHLHELARLRALSVTVLARSDAPAPAIDEKLASLRATLDETGAPRVAAETLLELAHLLPPASRRPDPLDLLDEAHALFLEMPIPMQEARCLEAMGDVLAARGDSAAARHRYLAAHGTYERYGLGLRLPLLKSKLDRLGQGAS